MTTKAQRGAAMSAADIRSLYELKTATVTRRPELARQAARTLVLLDQGLECHVEHGDRCQDVALPPDEGGTGAAPAPDQLMRASIGASLALGYRVWAARLGVPLASVELSVTCQHDARGALDAGGETPGWSALTVDVTIASSASEAELRRVVAVANGRSPMLANLSRDIAQVHRLTITPTAASHDND